VNFYYRSGVLKRKSVGKQWTIQSW